MFANFIYFIIALIVLTLYEPMDAPPYSILEALSLLILLALAFGLYTHLQFRRLERMARTNDRTSLDQRFTLLMTRHTMFALVLFAIDIWALHLPSFLYPITWLAYFPTLNALLFLLIFIGYLVMVWRFSAGAQRAVYRSDISRKAYVRANIAFCIPILIPWLLLSGLTDIIQVLPFQWSKDILESAFGQIGSILLFLIIAAVFAPVLIQRFWRCHPLESGFLRERIEVICRRADIRYADIVYWPLFGGRMITAGVMGLVGRFRYILVTDALLKILRPEEIDQVIAHEIGHIRRKHLLLYLLFFIGFMLVWHTALFLSQYAIASLYPIVQRVGIPIGAAHNIILATLLIASAVCYFRYIFGYFMRNFERQADLFVFELFPSAQPLIDTFDKIVLTSGQSADKPNWHHFSIQQRIDYLRRCEKSSFWIKRHDSKIRKSIAAYLAGVILLGAGLYHYHQWFSAQQMLADGIYYFEKGFEARAAESWEQVIALFPDDAVALNNLAWLLATTGDEALRNPGRSLDLAQKAIHLEKAPHIWDTYAEALFVNGRIEEAILAEEKALAQSSSGEAHIYRGQLERFKKALATPSE